MAMHFKKLGASRSYRAESGEFLCDGLKLLEDAVNSNACIPAVLTAVPIPFPLSVDSLVFNVDRALIDSLSPLKNAQGLLFSCKMRDHQGTDEKNSEFGIRNAELGEDSTRGQGTDEKNSEF